MLAGQLPLLHAERLADLADIIGRAPLKGQGLGCFLQEPIMRAAPPGKESAPPPSAALRQRDHGEPCRLREGPGPHACGCRRSTALRGALAHVRSVLETELNSATPNNPLISSRKRSNQRWELHGQPLL